MRKGERIIDAPSFMHAIEHARRKGIARAIGPGTSSRGICVDGFVKTLPSRVTAMAMTGQCTTTISMAPFSST